MLFFQVQYFILVMVNSGLANGMDLMCGYLEFL